MGRYGDMIHFSNMENFHTGYQFFMSKPSNAIKSFIFVVAGILIAALVWANIAEMDDVVKANVSIRPEQTISVVKILSGGQVQEKNYLHNEFVHEGDLILQLNTSADVLELKNSQELMTRIDTNIQVFTSLIETIRQDANSASKENEEAYIHSERYLLENQQHLSQIKEIQTKLEKEKSAPGMLLVQQQIHDIEIELERAELQFALWKNSRIIETTDSLDNLQQSKKSLERRMSDLEHNIHNATIYSPIDGMVNEFRKLNIGDNVVPGEEIITIVPQNEAELKAELYIEPAYIARVKTGQIAVLRFPGLPPSKYGKIEAEIDLIPADYNAVQDSVPLFVVEASIKDPWLESPSGERIYLRAGIGASGRIVIDRDTVFRTLLKKLDFINENYEDKESEET
jgi:adhesin transport system membrane fusion protein